MAQSNADRQRAYRQRHKERHRQEHVAARARAELRAILALDSDPACCCCGERYPDFLRLLGEQIYCRNCASVIERGGVCPHRGIIARIG